MSNVKKKQKEKEEEKKKTKKDDNNNAQADRLQRKKKAKRNRVIIISVAIVVIVIVLIIGLWPSERQDYPTVSKILDGSDKYIDKEIEFRGTVKKDSLDFTNKEFVLTDDKNELKVVYTELLPSNFEEGKDVVIKGILRQQTGFYVEANEIIVGCASKY